ncbi:MAG: hypothetical protein AAF423_06195 [Pseudomonadota bacterium]
MQDSKKIELLFEHKLQTRRILLEKLLLAGLLIVAAVFGNFLVEKYKSGLVERKFLLEKRLAAIEEIGGVYSQLTLHFRNATSSSGSSDEQLRKYKEDIENFSHLVGKKGMLFDEKYEERFKNHLWTHLAATEMQGEMTKDHYAFGLIIFQDFENLTRELLWSETINSGATGKSALQFDINSGMKATEFFNKNYERWKSH